MSTLLSSSSSLAPMDSGVDSGVMAAFVANMTTLMIPTAKQRAPESVARVAEAWAAAVDASRNGLEVVAVVLVVEVMRLCWAV